MPDPKNTFIDIGADEPIRVEDTDETGSIIDIDKPRIPDIASKEAELLKTLNALADTLKS